jgi:hypothetical protein
MDKEKEEEILDYIQGQLDQKKSKEDIINALLGMGWSKEDIDKRFQDLEDLKAKKRKKIIVSIITLLIILIGAALIISTKFQSKGQTIQGYDLPADSIKNDNIADERTGAEPGLSEEEIRYMDLLNENLSRNEVIIQ